MDASIGMIMKEELADCKAELEPADPKPDLASQKRAKRLGVLLDGLSNMIGRGYGLLVRQPNTTTKKALHGIEEAYATMLGMVVPDSPVDQEEFRGWQDQIQDLTSKLWDLFPSMRPKAVELGKKRKADELQKEMAAAAAASADSLHAGEDGAESLPPVHAPESEEQPEDGLGAPDADHAAGESH